MSPDDLFARHHRWAKTFAASLFKDMPPEVTFDELHAAALEGVWRASLSWRSTLGASFNTHARLCAKRCMIDHLRKLHRKRYQRFYVKDVGFLRTVPDHRRSSYDASDDHDEAQTLLQRFKQPLRAMLEEYFLWGWTLREIARAHHIWVSEVSRRLSPYIRRAGLPRNRRAA